MFKTNRYPLLSSLVCPCLNIFTGPMVECVFSMMNYFIDSRSGRIKIEGYSTIMTTKYSLKSSKSAALKFNWKVILRDPVDLKLSCYIVNLHHVKKCLKTKRDKMLLKKKNLSSKKVFSEVAKKRRKETVHKEVIIYLFVAVF